MAETKGKVAVLAGDGIGPEVMEATLKVAEAAEVSHGFRLEWKRGLVGGAAIDATGKALPEDTVELCRSSTAVLFGSVGGPKWESLPPNEQPERAALLPLRKIFGLYANLRPAVLYPELTGCSPLRPERVAGGFDVLVVRELTGGLYFGQPKETVKKGSGERAVDTMVYETHEIERVAEVAFRAAAGRKKQVTLVDKANVLESSLLWRKTVKGIAARHPGIALDFIYVDNAAMQLVRDPGRFDVLLCENLFGDILSDEAAAVAGSLGMLPSASLGQGNFGLYEPAGGSAPDIAGKGIANPIAQILSLAMMLEMSFGNRPAAESIRGAVAGAIRDGWRTADIAAPGEKCVGTREMAGEIARRVASRGAKG
ncbi:MAG: 3-isopropylmalate dehydrogenase [Verrucomicrobia bacterium]|nr:3-isopropylmalate dehydrogenase [Verrucomicrobiota bacterium]